MSFKKLQSLAQASLERENPTLQQLRKIKKQGQLLNPVPEKWEEFVKLCLIRSGGRMVQFHPYLYQKILAQLIDEFPNLVIIKSRQVGVTQAVISKFLERACKNPGYSSVAFMRNQGDVAAISRRARQMLKGLESCGLKADSDNVGYLRIKNAGDIYLKNSSKEGIRSLDGVVDQFYDEAAFVPRIEDIYSASSPSGAMAGDEITKIICSTPSQKAGWFWQRLSENNQEDVEELCQQVATGKRFTHGLPGFYQFVDHAGVCKVVLHFLAHPEYAKIHKEYPGGYLAYRMQIDNIEQEQAEREYNLRFIDAAVSVFGFDLVEAAVDESLDYEEKKRKGTKYYIGVDPNFGSTDYCCGLVLGRKEGEEKYSNVALYRKRNEQSQYNLYHLSQLIREFQPECVTVEVNGGGRVYYDKLVETFPQTRFIAIHTSEESKTNMVGLLLLALEKQILNFPVKSPAVKELLSYRREGKKMSAPSGQNDDCVSALYLCLQGTPFAQPEQRGTFAHVLDADIEELLRR